MPNDTIMTWTFPAIGVFHCAARHPYDAARQGVLAPDNTGEVRLLPGRNFAQALRDLDGFSHLWLLYVFHHNPNWKPLAAPPRGRRKVGVFASRAPYRPNPIGLSCVALDGVDGLTVRVRGHDLLDGTPILDLKPYIPYADSVPAARTGWLETAAAAAPVWRVTLAPSAEARLRWLEDQGVAALRPFLEQQLREDPASGRRKRVRALAGDRWEIAYRTWRAEFATDPAGLTVTILNLRSGYAPADLAGARPDRHGDHALHRAFQVAFLLN